jgi:hypothetical protein
LASEIEEMEQLSSYQQSVYERNEKDKKEPEQRQKPREGRWNSGLHVGGKSDRTANGKQKLRQGMHAITFTDESFNSVTRKRRVTEDEDDWDFAEFHEEDKRVPRDEEEDAGAGFSLADLPYKPLIDVYDLQRLSQEEFCPLTLDDDSSCEETRSWP